MAEKTSDYYAFISYSRDNSAAAVFLHRQLEHFRLPIRYIAPSKLPGNKKYLRPIFRDRRDLPNTSSSFSTDIKKAIESTSKYMIVLCSPEAAKSTFVNEEIKYFLATHNNDYNAIVPVILSGRPGTGDEQECLPEALRNEHITSRNLPCMIPDAGLPQKHGWEYGVVQALSYMLDVERVNIKAAVDAEKLRQTRIYLALGIITSIIFAGLFVWALNAEHRATIYGIRAQKAYSVAQKHLSVTRKLIASSQNLLNENDPTQKQKLLEPYLEAIAEANDLNSNSQSILLSAGLTAAEEIKIPQQQPKTVSDK